MKKRSSFVEQCNSHDSHLIMIPFVIDVINNDTILYDNTNDIIKLSTLLSWHIIRTVLQRCAVQFGLPVSYVRYLQINQDD